MQNYEIVYILQADLDEATTAAAVETIDTLIKTGKGEISKTDIWGKRKLAYPIKKAREGYYVLVTFTAEPAEIANIRRTLGYNEQVLRSNIVRVD